MLSILHDVGAYKTEEINRMLEFETELTYGHSVYGYSFIKYTTPLDEYAEAILYHHTAYNKMNDKKGIVYEYAQLIHLADRIDVLTLTQCNKTVEDTIRASSGTLFNPKHVEAFFKANENYEVLNGVRNGFYTHEIDDIVSGLESSEEDVLSYLRMIILAIDFTSPYTVTHTANTMTAAMELGKLLGLNERELEQLNYGALLHDIGKISTPQAILEKPGKLDSVETAIMRNHVVKTNEILLGLVSDEVRLLASRHHEKLDGSGYPLGLKEEDLTLPQRILAVADILSALLGKRSYKDVFPKSKVIDIVKKMSAKGELDQNVTNAFISNYSQIHNALEESNNSINALYRSISDEYRRIQLT